MSRLFYSLCLYLAVPFILLRLLYRALRAPSYLQRWGERFGFFSLPAAWQANDSAIWIHAVSVGEALAAAPLIRHLQKTRPAGQILVSTMTPTGSARVRELFGAKVFHVYLPYDLPGAQRRFLQRIRPALLVVMETELWPNLLYHCHRQGVKVLLANARLSEKSARGYRRLGPLTRSMLRHIDLIAVQAQADAQRFARLGATQAQLQVTGSLKFDMDVPSLQQQDLPPLFQQITGSKRPVLIAASTREGEEEKVLRAFVACLSGYPDLLLVLVPRHPERFNAVVSLCEKIPLSVQRRSTATAIAPQCQVLVGDSMGEMWFYYALADIAFVGGSLVDTGCHNVLEPAAIGLPVLVGPSQFNFATICRQLEEAGALKTVADETALGKEVMALLDNPQWRNAMGSAGKLVLEQNRGVLQRLTAMLDQLQPRRL